MTSASPAPDASAGRGAVLIPVKDFSLAKSRLRDALDPNERAMLARAMATHVVRAQQSTPVVICCDDADVATWADEVGATVAWCPDSDLNGAVRAGFEQLRADGCPSVAIAHSDLPRAIRLEPLLGWPGVTIVPDRHRTGTNVMSLPTDLDFSFQYGAGSFQHHVREAVRLRRGLRIVHDPDLAWDVDDPTDLHDRDGDVRRLLERTTP